MANALFRKFDRFSPRLTQLPASLPSPFPLLLSPPKLPSVLFREQNLVVARETERDRGDIVEDKKRKRPEDIIPDLPENQKAREFLKNAPTKGLWLPLGAEVKVMQ
jgi:hypothetical protein